MTYVRRPGCDRRKYNLFSSASGPTKISFLFSWAGRRKYILAHENRPHFRRSWGPTTIARPTKIYVFPLVSLTRRRALLPRRRRLPHLSPPRSPSPAPSPAAELSLTRRRRLPENAAARPPGKTPPARCCPSTPHALGRCRPAAPTHPAAPHAVARPSPAHTRPARCRRTAAATRSPTRLPASQGDVNFSSFVSNCEWYL
jgi:hypothetical protein